MGAEPVGGGLRARRLGVEQAAVGPDRDKNPGLLQHPRGRVGIEGRITRVIDKQSVAGQVGQAHRHAAATPPLLELHAKGGVFEPLRVSRQVLTPQLTARHVLAPQFPLDPLKIRRRMHLDARLRARI